MVFVFSVFTGYTSYAKEIVLNDIVNHDKNNCSAGYARWTEGNPVTVNNSEYWHWSRLFVSVELLGWAHLTLRDA
jgi:hypothetical protein